MAAPPVVTLTTDFGTADGYVGAMKGVILGIAPSACLVDISHEITQHCVREAAFVLHNVYPHFPQGTVHLAVVDPGVGSERRPLAFRTPAGVFVGPDNGIFTYVINRERIHEMVQVSEREYRRDAVSDTFHGRDVFAPAAAYLASGVPLSALGPAVDDPVMLAQPLLEIGAGCVKGEVLHVDRFGNAVSSIGRLEWSGEEVRLCEVLQGSGESPCVAFPASSAAVTVGGREVVGVSHTYTQVRPGDPVCLVGSGGHLEIAVREGNGAREFGLKPGDPVVLSWLEKA